MNEEQRKLVAGAFGLIAAKALDAQLAAETGASIPKVRELAAELEAFSAGVLDAVDKSVGAEALLERARRATTSPPPRAKHLAIVGRVPR